MEIRISEPAKRHQERDRFNDEDIRHAVRNFRREAIGNDDLPMFIGPAQDGRLLEVGYRECGNVLIVVHAMNARDQR